MDLISNRFYIYAHFKKSTNELFYIGKGNGKRCFSSSHRNAFWRNTVNKHGFYCKIIEKDLTEELSLAGEIFYIKHFKMIGCKLVNMTDGGEGTSGIKRSDDFIKKISGEGNPNYGNKGVKSKLFGRKHSCDSILKMSEKAKKVPVLQCSKEGIAIKEWPSAKEANVNLGIDRNHICSCCRGKIKLAGGYVWKYKL